MTKVIIITLLYLIGIGASFIGGRNYERVYQRQQRAQPTVQEVRKKYKDSKGGASNAR